MSSFISCRSTSFCKHFLVLSLSPLSPLPTPKSPDAWACADGSIYSETKRRNGGGMLRSTPRLFMLAVTSAMFFLGLVVIVLKTSLEYQQFSRLLSPSGGSSWSIRQMNVLTAVGATTTCIIVSNSFFRVV
jgi:hypothetical protein